MLGKIHVHMVYMIAISCILFQLHLRQEARKKMCLNIFMSWGQYDFFLGCGRGGGGGRGGGVALSLVAVLAAVGSDIVDRGGGGGGGGAGQVRDLGGGGGGRGVNAVAAAAAAVSGVPVVVLPDVQRDLRKLLIID